MNDPSLDPKPKSLNRQLLGKIKLGVKPKLQWNAFYKVVDNSQNNLHKNLQVLEFFSNSLNSRGSMASSPSRITKFRGFCQYLETEHRPETTQRRFPVARI
jgi:hypothetical protein